MKKYLKYAAVSLAACFAYAWGYHNYGDNSQFSKYYVLTANIAHAIATGEETVGCRTRKSGFDDMFQPTNVGGYCLLRAFSASHESTYSHPMFWIIGEWAFKGDGEDLVSITFTERDSNLNFEFRFISETLNKIDEASGEIFGGDYCFISPNNKILHKGGRMERKIIPAEDFHQGWINEFNSLASFDKEVFVNVRKYDKDADKCGDFVHRMVLSRNVRWMIWDMMMAWQRRYEMIPDSAKRREALYGN